MLLANESAQLWKAYLDELQSEVVLGLGIFGEDEQLRMLLDECFTDGDSLNGIVYWENPKPQLN
jgi:hypothetical protein